MKNDKSRIAVASRYLTVVCVFASASLLAVESTQKPAGKPAISETSTLANTQAVPKPTKVKVIKKPIDATYLATVETQMWQAYYGNNKLQLGMLLIKLLNGKYQMPPMESAKTANFLALAAMKFKAGKNEKQFRKAIPDLVSAYTVIKPFTGLSFDPQKVAEAELAWWVDRRTPGKNDPKTVGNGITRLYEAIYGYKHTGFDQAGQLRAQAAHIRDKGGKNCDWQKIQELLLKSYQALKQGAEKK